MPPLRVYPLPILLPDYNCYPLAASIPLPQPDPCLLNSCFSQAGPPSLFCVLLPVSPALGLWFLNGLFVNQATVAETVFFWLPDSLWLPLLLLAFA